MICVLFSGGLDSMVLAEMAHERGILGSLFHVSYGQRASSQEFRAAKSWADSKGYPLHYSIISVQGLADMNERPGIAGPRIVPGRNLILIAHAVNYAAAKGLTEVWYGACADDLHDYADCRPDFVSNVCSLTMGTEGVQLVAPLINSTKKDIVQQAFSYGLTQDQAWSCYAPHNDQPCGQCNSCRCVQDALHIDLAGGVTP